MNATMTHPLMLRRRSWSQPSAWAGENKTVLVSAAYFIVHVPLCIMMHQSSSVATVHGVITIAAGVGLALLGRRLEHVLYACAYIIGAEVLWRMCGANVFWESGKYAVSLVILISMIRRRRFGSARLPLAYFMLLLPSAFALLMELEPEVLRRRVSFNLSGPLALMVCARFFSQLKLNKDQLRRIFISLIGPIVGIAAITLFTTWTAANLTFSRGSNLVTSGGFGANQVSSALGLGALAALMCLLLGRSGLRFKVLIFGTLLVLAVQSMLTFSRGGIYNMAVGAVLAFVCLTRNAGARLRIVLIFAILVSITYFILLPQLDSFTGGAFTNRFSSTSTTGRSELAEADIKIWLDNPVFGVGPGESTKEHGKYFRDQIAHTEMTRLLSEHGAFGLVALALLLIMCVQRFFHAKTAEGKALVASSLGWSIIYMLNAAMRLVAPAFMFGLAFVTIVPDRKPRPSSTYRDTRRLKVQRRPQTVALGGTEAV
jgi:hypothetical protein